MTTTKAKGRAAIAKLATRLNTLKIEYVPAASISPNDYNPNRQSDHEFYMLILSIDEDGFTQPVIVNRDSHRIIDGEHRWTAMIVWHYLRLSQHREGPLDAQEVALCRSRRLEIMQPDCHIPVVFTDMTAEQMRISTLRHNRARGSEDLELTALVMKDLQQMGALDWAKDSLQLDDVEVNNMLNDTTAMDALAGEEFGQAWAPGHTEEVQAREQVDQDGGTSMIAATQEAVERRRQGEAAMRQARTEEERRKVREEVKMYRVSLMFTGTQADLVRRTLGAQPAEALLRLCLDAERAKQVEGAMT